LIREENITWAGMVDDYNSVDKFKSDIVANLNEYEKMWSSQYSDYKPFISYSHDATGNDELDSSFNDLNIQDDRL